MSDAQDLATLSDEVVTLEVGGKKLVINRIRMRQLPRVLELVLPMKNQLMKQKPKAKDHQPTKVENIDISELVFKHTDALVQLIAEIESFGNEGVDEKWVGDLEVDDMINLAAKVIEVNLDFFIQKVVPALSTALASLNAGIRVKFLGGLIHSPSS